MITQKLANPAALAALRAELIKGRDEKRPMVVVCAGTGCQACGCEAVARAFRESLAEAGLSESVELKLTGCHGPCERGPLVVIQPEGIFYQHVAPADAQTIVTRTLKAGHLVEKLLYKDPASGEAIVHDRDIPFYKKQMRLISGLNPKIDPRAINDYIIAGGYAALAKSLAKFTPEAVVDEIRRSGLRGRGGGGFLAGRKWDTCRRAEGDIKYVICNADEGDPGAFMDRSLLEGNPHIVIEGMIIGAHAIGSRQGYVYVRNEYPLAFKNLSIAIDAARELGLLGEKILGSDLDFDIEVSRGGGAFVCGESTALMASLEGKIGEPRAKYVHTVAAGLWNKPSCLNNVETWANVPMIIDKGADWYAGIGTASSKGTKIFALSGKVRNTGLVEVPMGITLREILYDIGGGVRGNKRFKAVQTGGPSGGTLVVETGEEEIHKSLVAFGAIRDEEEIKCLLDLPVDFDELSKAGSMMGSGGMIVMDEDSCMVDIAKYFLKFLQEESCGKCLPCREGLRVMLDILERISSGEGHIKDLVTLEELSAVMIDTSLCQLGGSAPNPVLSTIRYFRQEYLAHIEEKRCPAGVCKELVSHAIDETCTGCHLCVAACPNGALAGEPKGLHVIDQDRCLQCGGCYQVCPEDSIRRVKRGEGWSIQERAREHWQPRSGRRRTVTVS